MDTAYQYRVTKYNPALRNRHGSYPVDDWTSVSDIGKPFGGVVLTRERYDRVETAYAAAAVAFMREAGTAGLIARGVENYGKSEFAPIEGTFVGVGNLDDMIRRLLREEFWCRLESDDSFIHLGYDYYMYVGVPRECAESSALARSLGLFVEPFRSPYRDLSG